MATPEDIEHDFVPIQKEQKGSPDRYRPQPEYNPGKPHGLPPCPCCLDFYQTCGYCGKQHRDGLLYVEHCANDLVDKKDNISSCITCFYEKEVPQWKYDHGLLEKSKID